MNILKIIIDINISIQIKMVVANIDYELINNLNL